MQLARIAERTDRESRATPWGVANNRAYWLDARYAPRVLHFSAFIIIIIIIIQLYSTGHERKDIIKTVSDTIKLC